METQSGIWGRREWHFLPSILCCTFFFFNSLAHVPMKGCKQWKVTKLLSTCDATSFRGPASELGTGMSYLLWKKWKRRMLSLRMQGCLQYCWAKKNKAAASSSGRNKDEVREERERKRKLPKHAAMSAGGGKQERVGHFFKGNKDFQTESHSSLLLAPDSVPAEWKFLLNHSAPGFAYTNLEILASWSFQKQKYEPLVYLLSKESREDLAPTSLELSVPRRAQKQSQWPLFCFLSGKS